MHVRNSSCDKIVVLPVRPLRLNGCEMSHLPAWSSRHKCIKSVFILRLDIYGMVN